MTTKICHRKLTKGCVNVCTLTLGTTNRLGVLFCGCPVKDTGLHGTEFLTNCSHYRSMNRRY
jgi:hypothetical protein